MTVAQALRPPSRTLLLLEGRAVQELGAFMLLRPWLTAAPRGDGHPVLVFPGLLASDLSTQPLRGFLKVGNLVVRLSFPFVHLPRRAAAFLERLAPTPRQEDTVGQQATAPGASNPEPSIAQASQGRGAEQSLKHFYP